MVILQLTFLFAYTWEISAKIVRLLLATIIINPLILTTSKSSLMISMKRHSWETFEEGMSLRTLPTTLLQIFRKIIFNSKVIAKSIKDPDDNFVRISLWVKVAGSERIKYLGAFLWRERTGEYV